MELHDSGPDRKFCVIKYQKADNTAPVVVTCSIVVDGGSERTWQLHIHGHPVNTSLISSLSVFPSTVKDESVISDLLTAVNQLKTCIGNPRPNYVNLGKAKKEQRVSFHWKRNCSLFRLECCCYH